MKTSVIITFLILNSFQLIAQQNNAEEILAGIEKNNTTLAAFRKLTDAEKIGNRTGIYLSNPDVEFNYLWGSPSDIGNRTDVTIRQSVDFPTVYKFRSQISELKNQQAELEYRKQRIAILYEARLLCTGIVHANAIKSALADRLDNARQVARSYKRKFEAGETNILEYNKAEMSLLNISKDAEIVEIERNAKLAELANLNGGIEVELNDSVFDVQPVETDFETWYAQAEKQNPVLQWIKQEVVISEKQRKQNVAKSLPKLNAGYMSEKVVGMHYQGITSGISIPLWENKNTLKYADARIEAMQSAEHDAKIMFYNRMKALHTKVLVQQKSVEDYRNMLAKFNNHNLLKTALDKGEISLTEYLLEQSLYFESYRKMLDSELELYKTIAELNQYR